MRQRLLVIALDAAEADVLEEGIDTGRFPNLAGIARQGSSARLTNSMEFLPGTIWPELHTGRSGWRDGHFCHVAQLHAGETRPRPTRVDEIDIGGAWFNVAAQAGRRVVVVDPPQMLGDVGPRGVSVDQWQMHDHNWDMRVEPPELAPLFEAAARETPYPVCDSHHGDTIEGYRSLLADLKATVAAKRDITVQLLERPWDVAFVTFTESHCAGHQFWHFRDPGSPFHDPDAPGDLRDAVETIYTELDAAIGALVAAAGDDALVVVVTSHGMQWEVGGQAALTVALTRLGYGSDDIPLAEVRRRIPAPVRRLARRVVPRRVVDALGADARHFERGGSTRAVTVPNNRGGAVRLRVRGRDPGGVIDPDEVAEVLTSLRSELAQLRTVATGEPVIASMTTPGEAFGPDAHADLPDLLIDFRRDVGALDRVQSPATGVIEVPLRWPWLPRTGDHTDHTRVWLQGPGCEEVDMQGASAIDLAPTLLTACGVEVPSDMDGVSRLVVGRET
ncbi:MAG: alkaline phosphatase family protein [Acidimicrobiales bacterium]